MARHRNDPKRTHADLLAAATDAYAEHHASLRVIAQRAADEMKRRHDSAQVVEATRQPGSSPAAIAAQQER